MQNANWPWPKSPEPGAWPFDTITNSCLRNTVEHILPCPFCGSDEVAHITVPQYEKPGLPMDTWVQCNNCGVEVHQQNHVYKTALELWNQRA